MDHHLEIHAEIKIKKRDSRCHVSRATLPPIMVQWKMGPWKMSFFYIRVVFHFHDCGGKGISKKQQKNTVLPKNKHIITI